VALDFYSSMARAVAWSRSRRRSRSCCRSSCRSSCRSRSRCWCRSGRGRWTCRHRFKRYDLRNFNRIRSCAQGPAKGNGRSVWVVIMPVCVRVIHQVGVRLIAVSNGIQDLPRTSGGSDDPVVSCHCCNSPAHLMCWESILAEKLGVTEADA